MVGKNRNLAGNTGENRLSAARHACKEVRLDKPFRNEQIRIDCPFVEQTFAARRQGADADHILVDTAPVDNDVFFRNDFFTVFGNQFIMSCRPVHTGRYEDRNLNIRISLAQFCQELRHNNMAGHGTRMVAGNNGTRLLSFCQLAQFL